MATTDDQRPRTSAEVAAEVYRRSSEDNRKALLNLHTRRTLAAASKALDNRWKWAGRYDAALILIKAAPKYVRLGGDLDPWQLGHPMDWRDLADRKSWR